MSHKKLTQNRPDDWDKLVLYVSFRSFAQIPF